MPAPRLPTRPSSPERSACRTSPPSLPGSSCPSPPSPPSPPSNFGPSQCPIRRRLHHPYHLGLSIAMPLDRLHPPPSDPRLTSPPLSRPRMALSSSREIATRLVTPLISPRRH